MTTSERRRSVAWADPMGAAHWAGRVSGMEFFAKLQSGEVSPPPISVTLGMELDSVEEGRVVFSVEAAEYHYNPIGVVHGGVIATLLDSAMGCAVHTRLPAGVVYTTLEIKVNYLRSARAGMGRIRAEGRAVHVGRQSAVAEGRVLDKDDKLLATASTTCIIMPAPGAG